MDNKSLFIVFLLLIGCREKKSSATHHPEFYANYDSEYVMVKVNPANATANVAIAVSEGKWDLAAPKTLPGVHWLWNSTSISQIEVAEGSGAFHSADSLWNQTLTAPFRLRYHSNLSQTSLTGYSVIGGKSTPAGGTISLPSYMFLVPNSMDARFRVQVESTGEPYTLATAASSCGDACAEFSSWMQMFEQPITFFTASSSVLQLGTPTQHPWTVLYVPPKPETPPAEPINAAYKHFTAAWNITKERWGTPQVGDGFRVHLLLDDSCNYQGLEHDSSTLLSVGTCNNSGLEQRLTHVAIHESLHTWNAKLVYPTGTATWQLNEFSDERKSALYYYEGFTEGYARILSAEIWPEWSQRNLWNTSIKTVRTATMGVSLSELSQKYPMLSYDIGALFSLAIAAELKKNYGVTEGQRRFWQLQKNLVEAGQFHIDHSLNEQRCFVEQSFVPCNLGSRGYSIAELGDAMKSTFALPNWDLELGTRLQNVWASSLTDYDSFVQSIGTAAGVAIEAEGGIPQFSAGTTAWPL